MMKKLIVFLSLILLCIACCLPAFAAEDELPDGSFENAEALFQYWETNGYPDYIGGLWTDNGTTYPLTFSLVNGAGREEVLRLLADDGSVVFATARYSRNALMRVQDELFAYFEQDVGLTHTGLMEMQNAIEIGIASERAEDARTKEFLDMLRREYGDMVYVVMSDGYTTYTMDVLDMEGASVDAIFTQEVRMRERWLRLGTLLGLALLCALATVLIFRHRHAAMLQTVSGEQVREVRGRLSRRQVEKKIKESESTPDASLEERIRSKL